MFDLNLVALNFHTNTCNDEEDNDNTESALQRHLDFLFGNINNKTTSELK